MLIRTSALNKTVFQHFLLILLKSLQKHKNIFLNFWRTRKFHFYRILEINIIPNSKIHTGIARSSWGRADVFWVEVKTRNTASNEDYPWHNSKNDRKKKKSAVETFILKSKAVMNKVTDLIQRNKGHKATPRITKMGHILQEPACFCSSKSFPNPEHTAAWDKDKPSLSHIAWPYE